MKNVFKFGFLALAIVTSLTACGFFGSKPKTVPVDTLQIDTAKLDTGKLDTNVLKSDKIKIDSNTIKH